MILIDANLLLYAYDAGSEFHSPARRWLESALSGRELIGLPWLTIVAFLRVSTNPRAQHQPLTMEQAGSVVSELLKRANVSIVAPAEQHWSILLELLRKTRIRGAAVTDAHLAALAIENGAVLHTADQGFARFPGLKFTNPLAV